jgi:hypothetical protein
MSKSCSLRASRTKVHERGRALLPFAAGGQRGKLARPKYTEGDACDLFDANPCSMSRVDDRGSLLFFFAAVVTRQDEQAESMAAAVAAVGLVLLLLLLRIRWSR